MAAAVIVGPARGGPAVSRGRLLGAAVLCFVPFGLVWSVSGTIGTTVFVPTLSVVPDYNLGGTTLETGGYVSVLPGSYQLITGAQSPARVLLGLAVLCFVLAAWRRAGDRLLTVGVAALLAADALAVAARASVVLLVLLAATVVALPPQWRSLEARRTWRASRGARPQLLA